MPDIVGQTIDRYQIMEQLGQGGMATVYLAFDLRLDRKVAVKVIRRDVFPPVVLDRVLKRFEREAKALAKLNHLNIVSIIDFGTYDGSPYLVMPYIPSGTLKDKLGKPIHYNQAAQILAPIARALAYAHDQEIIHRDVKPANILITQSGDPVLTDFGVAKLLEEVDGNTLTGTGMGLGTPEYMAPEQWQGKADARSDQYALGVILFEMVTGQKPYTADTPIAIMLKQLNEPLPNLRHFTVDLPEEVEFSVLKMMAKDPENRFPSMSAVARVLEQASNQQFPIRDQTGYFDNNLDQEDEQTRYDQTPHPERISTSDSDKVSGVLNVDISSEDTIDQVENLEASQKFEDKKSNGLFKSINFSKEKNSNRIKVSKKRSLSIAGILIFGIFIAIIPLLSSHTNLDKPLTKEIGSTMISKIDGMEMVYVLEGSFNMGIDHPEARPDEQPVHEVYLDAFWIDKFEVTNDQYMKCVMNGGCELPKYTETFVNPIYINHPVRGVNWYDAQAYCIWAGRELPTEAQWEKAARSTDGRIYPWGNEKPNNNFVLQTNNLHWVEDVGSYPLGASPYGAMDMAGNVMEWVADWYDVNYYSKSPSNNPHGPISGNIRVLRGGSSFGEFGTYLRSSDRGGSKPDTVEANRGFRCAKSD